jgi:hypothetical protein
MAVALLADHGETCRWPATTACAGAVRSMAGMVGHRVGAARPVDRTTQIGVGPLHVGEVGARADGLGSLANMVAMKRYTIDALGPDAVSRPTGKTYWSRRSARRDSDRLRAPHLGVVYPVRRFWRFGGEFDAPRKPGA